MDRRTCIHPHCHVPMERGRIACGRHWRVLDDGIRRRYRDAYKAGPDAVTALNLEAIDYFHSRLIGDNEIVTCRTPACRADIVFMLTSRGKTIPVNAETVTAEDTEFNPKKHVAHFTNCPGADAHRRDR